MSDAFTLEEVETALKSLKNGKAPGNDNVHTEFLKNLSHEAISWLQAFLSTCMTTSRIPSKWKTAKVIAILKPKKPADDPKSYRPISLLSHLYKLLERLILERINNTVEEKLPTTQAGFRKGKSTTDQVVRLVNDIEAAFQENHKFGAVFVDLTAAYDTVWHRGLYLKTLQIIQDVRLVKFIMLLVQDRYLRPQTANVAGREDLAMAYHKALFSPLHCSTSTCLICQRGIACSIQMTPHLGLGTEDFATQVAEMPLDRTPSTIPEPSAI